MKKLLALLMVLSLVFLGGCVGDPASIDSSVVLTPKVLSAKDIFVAFKDADLPVSGEIIYTEDTDVNNLLGRPNQYISKVNFADARIEQSDAENPEGGSVETFANAKDLNVRKEYLEKAFSSMPALTEYLIVNDKYLLRLNRALTNNQVEEYSKVFKAL